MKRTTNTDDQLARDLQEAMRPLLQAIERPPLAIHSTHVEQTQVVVMLELPGTESVWQLTVPLAEPGRATLHLVSGHRA